MLKPLESEYRGRKVILECTHKRTFPPPQMYGATDEDVDNLWRQGNIGQTEYQLLKTWQEKCHLMVMGPRCLDCPLALKRNPRPGRPNVIETEPWLAAKERMHWEDMKGGRQDGVSEKRGFVKLSDALAPPREVVLKEPDEEEAPDSRELDEEDAPDARELDEEDAPEEPEEDPEMIFKDEPVSTDLDVIAAIAGVSHEIREAPSRSRGKKKGTRAAEEIKKEPQQDEVSTGQDKISLDDDVISALADD
jgi:hypothetical protein